MKKIKEKIVVLYDGVDCPDGFSGAWVVWKKFGNKAAYVGVSHQSPVPKGLKNKIIYMIDFTYTEKIVKKLIKDNISITSIDHHFSALEAIKLTKNYSYSEDNSGSMLAWKYFFPSKLIPKLLKYVEDGDLWINKLPHTKEISAYLNLFEFKFKDWEKLAAELENPGKFKKCVEIGGAVLRYENRLVDFLINTSAEKVIFEGHKALAVNSPFFSSQVGNKLINRDILIGIVWKMNSNEISVSLRSDGRVDVSKLAKKYGGGGHKAAAGFKIKNRGKFPWETIK